jgi:hypothetical protein
MSAAKGSPPPLNAGGLGGGGGAVVKPLKTKGVRSQEAPLCTNNNLLLRLQARQRAEVYGVKCCEPTTFERGSPHPTLPYQGPIKGEGSTTRVCKANCETRH